MAQLNPETDFELKFESAHVARTPDLLQQCAACLKVNRQTLTIFSVTNQHELVSRLGEVFRDDTLGQMLTEMIFLWNGTLEFSSQTVNYALDGRRIDARIHVRVLQGHEATWDRAMVALEDTTAATQAQLQLARRRY